jgi:hypothetical protein
VWHLLTLAYLFMAFWGVLVQLLVIFPPQVQRVLFAGGYLWFLYAPDRARHHVAPLLSSLAMLQCTASGSCQVVGRI